MSNTPQFADNSGLYGSYNAATVRDFTSTTGGQTFASSNVADAFTLHSSTKGHDTITGFSASDTLMIDHKLYDGNGDGYIDFGSNNTLDINRTGTGNAKAGKFQLTVTNPDGSSVGTIRYLGTKGGENVYSAASTGDQLLGHFTSGLDSTHGFTGGDASLAGVQYRYESSVNNDTINAGNGSTAVLFDNALGVNLGSDIVNNFGKDDLLIFTSKLYDGNNDGKINFGSNNVLDLSSQSPNAQDGAGGPGGQLEVTDTAGHLMHSLTLLGQETIGTGANAVTYYYYGTPDHGPIGGVPF